MSSSAQANYQMDKILQLPVQGHNNSVRAERTLRRPILIECPEMSWDSRVEWTFLFLDCYPRQQDGHCADTAIIQPAGREQMPHVVIL